MKNIAVQMLPYAQVKPSPTNPRKTFNETSLAELAQSITEHGIASPLTVRPVKGKCAPDGRTLEFEIVFGERRYRAGKLAKLDLLPCIVRDLTDEETRELQQIENLQREDLSILEEAEGLAAMVATGKWTADTLAAKLGKSRSHVYGRLKLAKLPEKVKKQVVGGKLNPAVAELVARIPGEELQAKALKDIEDGADYDDTPMSVREVKRLMERDYTFELKKAGFDPEDAQLKPSAGICSKCPKRTGNARELFPEKEYKNPNVCTDPECFEAKTTALFMRAASEAAKQGLKVLSKDDARKCFAYNDVYDLTTWRCPYVSGGEKVERDSKKRTYIQLLGQEMPLPLACIGKDGKIHKVYPASELNALLVKKGLVKPEADAKQSPAEKAKAARRKLLEDLGGDLVEEVISAIAATKENARLEKVLRAVVACRAGNFDSEMERVLGANGIKTGHDAQTCFKALAKTGMAQLIGFLAGAEVEEDGGPASYDGWTKGFQLFADIAGVDLRRRKRKLWQPRSRRSPRV